MRLRTLAQVMSALSPGRRAKVARRTLQLKKQVALKANLERVRAGMARARPTTRSK
jgi:hypothetical protein